MPQPLISTAATAVGPLPELSWPQRALAAARPTRRLSRVEIEVASAIAFDLDFEPLLPCTLPRGYAMAAATLVPHGRTLVTLEFRGPGSHQFKLTEQLAVVSFADQHEPGRLPSTQVRIGDTTFTVYHGAFDGTEPIDGLHWHDRRRAIVWDQGGLICRLDLLVGESPAVWQALRIARSTVPLADFASGR